MLGGNVSNQPRCFAPPQTPHRTPPQRAAPPSQLPFGVLIDRHLPVYGWNEVHAVEVDAPPETVMAAVRAVTAGEIRLARVLMSLRSLPTRLARGRAPARDPARPVMEAILRAGFIALGEDKGREVVVGTIGRFWQPCPVHADVADAAAFDAFDTPGWAKAVMNFTVTGIAGGRTRLVTETRIAATDAAARRRFGLYWMVVHPGSAIIRRTWLRAVKRRAERP